MDLFAIIESLLARARSRLLTILGSSVPHGNALLNSFWFHIMLILSEVEEIGQWAAIWQPSALLPQLVEVWIK